MEILVQFGQPCLPESCLVSKSLKVRGVLEGLKKTLVVPNLVDQVFPVFDDGELLVSRVFVVGEREGGAGSPQFQLLQGLSNRDLPLGSAVQFLQATCIVYSDWRGEKLTNIYYLHLSQKVVYYLYCASYIPKKFVETIMLTQLVIDWQGILMQQPSFT